MYTYEVRAEPPSAERRPSFNQKLITALCLAAFVFILRFGWAWISPPSGEKNSGLDRAAIEIGIWSSMYGAAIAFFTSKPHSKYKLLVGEDSITGVTEYTGWMAWLAQQRTVRKGKIRNIFEIKGRAGRLAGIGVSERSILGARMWGFVYVPTTLPQFEQLKHLAETWRRVVPNR